MSDPKRMLVSDWAKIEFGEKAPKPVTLQRWCNYGKIKPQPEKIGKWWWVVPHAKYAK